VHVQPSHWASRDLREALLESVGQRALSWHNSTGGCCPCTLTRMRVLARCSTSPEVQLLTTCNTPCFSGRGTGLSIHMLCLLYDARSKLRSLLSLHWPRAVKFAAAKILSTWGFVAFSECVFTCCYAAIDVFTCQACKIQAFVGCGLGLSHLVKPLNGSRMPAGVSTAAILDMSRTWPQV